MDFLSLNESMWSNSTLSNSTLSNSTDGAGEGERAEPMTAALSVIFGVLIMYGNSLIILSILREKELQTPSYTYVFALAIIDCLVGSISFFKAIENIFRDAFNIEALCVLRIHFGSWTIITSGALLAAMAVDRLYSIQNALRYHELVTMRITISVTLATVTSSILVSIVSVFLGPVDWHPTKRCLLTTTMHFNTSFIIVVYGFIAISVILISYTLLFIIAMKHQRKIASLELAMSQHSQKSFQANFKAAKTMLLITGTLMITWVPSTIFLMYVIFVDVDPAISFPIQDALVLGLMCNSLINPLIYALKIKQFKRGFVYLMTCGQYELPRDEHALE